MEEIAIKHIFLTIKEEDSITHVIKNIKLIDPDDYIKTEQGFELTDKTIHKIRSLEKTGAKVHVSIEYMSLKE